MIGLPYKEEVNDCLQLVRRYFEPLGIHIRDYAFPSDFWHYDDMYTRIFSREGFYAIDPENWKPQVSDVLLVAGAPGISFPTHLGVLIEESQVLHHYTGRLSEKTAFKGVWRRPILILRHIDIPSVEVPTRPVDISEFMTPHARSRFARNTEEQV